MVAFLQTGECTDPLSVYTAINAGQTFIHLVALLRIRDLMRKEEMCQCHILSTILNTSIGTLLLVVFYGDR